MWGGCCPQGANCLRRRGHAAANLRTATSSEVAPGIREFERISTTVANAYLMRLAARYVGRLAERVAGRGIRCRLLLMLSSGGLTDVEEARRFPVRTLESGPAAGAIAVAWFGARAGHDDLLAFDMGGTTAKLCLVDGGEPLVTHAFEACRERRFIARSGLPLKISALELIEIGAGGGSIARVDELGLLKTGPESAGSAPGPACCGLGGRKPTVTDADLVLGYLDPAFFAGGDMRLCPDAAATALASLEAGSGLAGVELARGIFEVVTETMASAARVHIAERGRDPRRYVLLATGGAGPVHAWHLAARLGIERVVCPPSAGVASALGLLLAPDRADRVATVAEPLARLDWDRFEATYRRIEEECRSVLAHAGPLGTDFSMATLEADRILSTTPMTADDRWPPARLWLCPVTHPCTNVTARSRPPSTPSSTSTSRGFSNGSKPKESHFPNSSKKSSRRT